MNAFKSIQFKDLDFQRAQKRFLFHFLTSLLIHSLWINCVSELEIYSCSVRHTHTSQMGLFRMCVSCCFTYTQRERERFADKFNAFSAFIFALHSTLFGFFFIRCLSLSACVCVTEFANFSRDSNFISKNLSQTIHVIHSMCFRYNIKHRIREKANRKKKMKRNQTKRNEKKA